MQTLFSFNSTNGAEPEAALTLGSDGNFYGTTSYGGITNSANASGMGTVFKISPGGILTTLVFFNGTNGANPAAALRLGNDGNYYGTSPGSTVNGLGLYVPGSVFKVNTNGILSTLFSFIEDDGYFPYGEFPGWLTLGNDDNFYGTTAGGGNGLKGTIFDITTNGTVTTLVSFNDSDGGSPATSLTLGNDGNFYGITATGGNADVGTIIKMTTNGTVTTLVSFSGTNGITPTGGLTLGNDGNFYGTTYVYSPFGSGTVFQVTTNGSLTTLVYFNGTNGAIPIAGVTFGNDGNFYGVTQGGGEWQDGTIFQVTTNGLLTTLVSFNGANGYEPAAALTLGNDGNFYGTTSEGGITNAANPQGMGTVFRLSLIPAFATQPQSQTNNAGASVTFVCSTILQQVGFQWQKNGTNLADGGNISGATSSTLTISHISDSDAASYSVVATNASGSTSSSIATLTVIDPPNIAAQPANLLVLSGTNASFGPTLTGTPPFSYQWRFNATNLLNATNAVYTIPLVTTNNSGNYSVVVSNPAGSVTSSNAALTVVLSPTSQTNYGSSTATFTVTAVSPESLNYQWQKNGENVTNGENISGATGTSLTIANLSDSDAASYSVVVSDVNSSVTSSNAMLTVIDTLFISTQPLSQAVAVGSNVTFTVIAYGASPFIFQWYFNNSPTGSPTSGTNLSSFTLMNVQTNQSGKYSVEIINDLGSVTSANATLTVVPPPIITVQPSSRTNNAGSTATFSVVASSVSALSYQWQKNGTNIANGGKISGATSSNLAITSVSDNEAGGYSVTVSNLGGSVTSSNAVLKVIPPPPLGLQILAGYPVLSLYGTGNNFVVQYNSSLSDTNWLNLVSISNLPSGPYLFLDPSGVGEPARFYRAFFTP